MLSLSRLARGSSGKGKPRLASLVQGSPVAACYRPPASATGTPVIILFHTSASEATFSFGGDLFCLKTGSPLDLFEDASQLLPSRWVHHFNKSDSAFKMKLKFSVPFAILAGGAVAHAIRQCGLETVDLAARDVETLVDDQAGEVLPHSTTHDARLARMRLETFLVQNSRDMNCKSISTTCKPFVAGKRQVVSVARIDRTCRSRKALQAAIQSKRTQI